MLNLHKNEYPQTKNIKSKNPIYVIVKNISDSPIGWVLQVCIKCCHLIKDIKTNIDWGISVEIIGSLGASRNPAVFLSSFSPCTSLCISSYLSLSVYPSSYCAFHHTQSRSFLRLRSAGLPHNHSWIRSRFLLPLKVVHSSVSDLLVSLTTIREFVVGFCFLPFRVLNPRNLTGYNVKKYQATLTKQDLGISLDQQSLSFPALLVLSLFVQY